LEITSNCSVTERNVRRISIGRTVTVVDTSLSDFADSSLRVASTDGSRTARAGDWSVDTSSRAKIARVDGAWILVITVLEVVFAASTRIASGDGTCIRSNTFRNMGTASRWVEAIDGAWITIITVWNDNFTFVGRRIALVVCASNRLADNCIIDTSSGRIAVSGGTCRSSWASDWKRDDSDCSIARVGDTMINWFCCNHLSRDVSEDTFSSASVAAIDGANALIVTDFCIVNADSAGKIARVSSTCIVVITVDWSVNTVSSVSIASIDCAFVGVITYDWADNTFS